MRRTTGLTASLLALLLAAFTISAKAEIVTASVLLSPANEVPPVTGLTASGGFLVTINVTRGTGGAITGGTVNFLGTVTFPGSVTITGLHIHEADALTNGGVVISSGLSGSSSMTFMTGTGLINLTAMNVDAAVLQRLLRKPTGFYVNLHTTVNAAGAIRGQITRLVETQAATVAMSTANEVPPITTAMGSGMGTITANPKRNPDTGEINGGTVTFSVQYDIPAGSVITGLHIHEGVAGVNAGVVINTGLSGSNSITTATGRGFVSIEVPITSANALAAFRRMVDNPVGFYVNLHTTTFTGGIIRGQLVALGAPPVIQQANTYFLETGMTDAPIVLLVSGIDLASTVMVNGSPVMAALDINTGALGVTIPGTARASAGNLFVQVRNGAGLMSAPLTLVVATSANVNATPVTTTDAAKFGNLVSPESIATGFGTNLATATVSATTQPLPFALDGTSVFVNGVAARLFFVSATQMNYLVPPGTTLGPASVVVVNKNGQVSRGVVNVSQSAPAIFTAKADGTGAPAAVASADGMVFNILMGNPDGTPREVAAGNFVALFGIGLRFASTGMAMTIGTTSVTALFVGPQGTLDGLDQVNLQIPASMAGAGDVNLIFTMDGKMSNAVRLRIR